MLKVSHVQEKMRLLFAAAIMVFIGHQAAAFTLPRKVDEPFGGLLHTMVNIVLPHYQSQNMVKN